MSLPIIRRIPITAVEIVIIPSIRIRQVSYVVIMAVAAKLADEIHPEMPVPRAFDDRGFIRRAHIGAYKLNRHYLYAGISDQAGRRPPDGATRAESIHKDNNSSKPKLLS